MVLTYRSVLIDSAFFVYSQYRLIVLIPNAVIAIETITNVIVGVDNEESISCPPKYL